MKMKEVIGVLSPDLIGKMIADLRDRGLSREQLANHFGVKGSMISQWQYGDAYPKDELLGKLAELHGGYSERELKTHKWVFWIMREK